MVKSPVLFETFARPDYARQVWNAIKASKPSTLYFYSNKARSDKPEEIKRNEEIRSFIQEIDWDCDLHTWYREEYVDVYTSLRGAVDWVCEHEEEWIVLEEDVVPTPAFFDFCDQMLDYYRKDMRVWNISGDNFWEISPHGYDYLFSAYHYMYGWASWRNRWRAVNWEHIGIDEMLQQDIYRYMYKTKAQYKDRVQTRLQQKDFLERTKCWDFMFGIAAEQHGAVQVIPARHLVTNIGLSGSHHKKGKTSFANIECTYNNEKYIINKRPPFVYADYEYDYLSCKYEAVYGLPLWKRKLYPILDFLGIREKLRNIRSMIITYKK